MVTVKDVADLAGVSTATVSRVLNNHPHVAEETRFKVLWAMEQLGYQPSRVARRLRMKSTQILGLIISDIANPFFTSVVRGIEDVAYAHQYSLLLCNSDEDPAKEALYVDVLQAERVAGIIISPADENSTSCEPLLRNGVPIVAMDRRLCQFDVDTVLVDNIKGAHQATSHLIRLGHRRIGLIGGPPHITTGRERREGYEKALVEHGLEPDQRLIKIGDFKQDSGYQGARELLEMDDPPTAIFAANNLMTLGALNAIHEKGLNIPRDVAIVGFDDMPWALSLNPPLTAVAQPTYELGRTAANLVLQRIAEKDREIVELRLEPTLIIRRSCGHHE
ncbi:MAG TPA: LacI family transcriptional regulator [Anaerolineae bacterium]|nr:LacI family transcriptional regulator [Anaerolineae bacterium]